MRTSMDYFKLPVGSLEIVIPVVVVRVTFALFEGKEKKRSLLLQMSIF